MKKNLGFAFTSAVICFFVCVSCNDASQKDGSNGQDTNYSDTRRNSGDTGYFIQSDTAHQKDVIDVNPPQKQR